MNQQDIKEYLYELPTCSICLLQLSSNINVLPCGHCFHQMCIETHLHKRSSCPNCRKYSELRDIRPIFYEVVRNCKIRESIQTLDLREEVNKLTNLITSYQEGTRYCYEVINCQQQEVKMHVMQNMELKKRLKFIQADMNNMEELGRSKLESFRQMLRSSRNKESILLREIRMLKLLLKFKYNKEKCAPSKIPMEDITNMGSLNEDPPDDPLTIANKHGEILRRSSSIS